MPEFFLELFSEEIPARMQQDAAEELLKICRGIFTELAPTDLRIFYGPRRIAFSATIDPQTGVRIVEARGPRENAPEAALAGFLGKHKVSREDLVTEGGHFWVRRQMPPVAAAGLIALTLPAALAKFSWPKSMRWGQGDDFTWVRPLRRIVCLLDGQIVPIVVGPIMAGNETEGHRVHAPGAFAVSSVADWLQKLRAHYVIADQDERRQIITYGIAELSTAENLSVVHDTALLDEVTGLVEWPVPLIGRIDQQFMNLPPEVRELSMKVNQKYFALRDAERKSAPYFIFVANLEAQDNGTAIIAGNERVLRARLADARHFWDMDLKTSLNDLVPKLKTITFHAKLGTQLDRSDRIAILAKKISEELGADATLGHQTGLAGYLCKADLVTGMVGEFPELQGIIGGYYAEKLAEGFDGTVIGPAIRTHYQPKGPGDAVPKGLVPCAVALADKLDTLTRFFAINEKPTGSGDPYALRRAALGVIRIILENDLTLHLLGLIENRQDLFEFIIERLRVKLRGEGERFDILDAVLSARTEDDLVRIMQRVNAVRDFLMTPDGANLLVAYRRAANILKIEDAKDGPHKGDVVPGLLALHEEEQLRNDLVDIQHETINEFRRGNFASAMAALAKLRATVDAFFDKVTVNDSVPEIRLIRLRLLAGLRDTMHQIADFSKIEG